MDETRQLVSLIIPTCNRAHWIEQTLTSVFEQTRLPDEIIVVNDGSTDDTLDILARYSGQIRLVEQTHAGRSAARNAGLRAASGDLIAFLDDDDRLPPDSIAARSTYLEQHHEVDVVYGEAQAINERGEILGPLRRVNPIRASGWVLGAIAHTNLAPIHAIMFRRVCFDQLGGFDEQLDSAEDWALWIRYAAQHRFGHIDACVAEYRFHSAMSSARDADQLARNTARVQAQVFALPEFQSLPAREQAQLYERHAIQNLRIGALDQSRRAYVRAIRAEPRRWQSYLLLTFVTTSGLLLYRLLRTNSVRAWRIGRKPYLA